MNSHSILIRESGRVYKSTWNSPSGKDVNGWPILTGLGAKGLTLNVILGVGVGGLVIVNHLYHLEEIIFAESLKAIGQLVHINLRRKSLDIDTFVFSYLKGEETTHALVCSLFLLGSFLSSCGTLRLQPILIARDRSRFAKHP